ncbi:helix-turn-helix domain-containing protein [Micromonospora carbonacea]|uniref:Helix-turn-helix transcriptional regulator n=1 Tax=Micromonospora carbonacea TaxID=47853 RepID=A0A7H8XM05_9ACTN|nr:helix-turn-helix transcriptional regulator [Micromonospora carbonacea]MBB5826485.1 transcriptional regulator with XRE-family HTH domain [Micromonospora carbonacea]QLD26006.1 helix-turn-helix transcriptional regulator [Micromonospora carbonacea]
MSASSRFAVRLRELLRERGVSFRALAARTYYGKSYLHDLAHGRKPPTPEVAARLDDALAAGGELVCLAGVLRDGRWEIDCAALWRHRDAEQLADLLVTTVPGPDNAAELAHQWLIADPPQRYELSAGRQVGTETVARVERRVGQLRRLDDHVGGAQTYAMVIAELEATAGLLRAGTHSEVVGRRLLAAAADLCQLAGFVAEDAGRTADARRYYLAGMRAAHAAGDTASAANCLSTLSYLEASTGDRREAVTLARSAYAGGRQAAEATGRALLLERVAWAHARVGEASQAERALGMVEEAYAGRDPSAAPPWAYWLSPDEVEIMAGRVWTELRRPLRAVPILERVTAGYGSEVPRESSLYLTWLAEALLQAGEVERAADVAGRALELARRAQSQRATRRVAELRRLLVEVAANSVAAREFVDLSTDLSVTVSVVPGGQ